MALNYLSLRSSGTTTATVQNLTYSTLTGSTLTAQSAGTFSTLIGSSMTAGSISNVSTAGISSLNVVGMGYSTLVGSTLYGSSGTISTLTGSTLVTGSVGVSTLTGSTLTSNVVSAPQVLLTSTVITLGQSTTQTQTNFSDGSYAAGSWITAKSSLVNGRKVAMSSSGQYQIIVSGGTNDLWLSSDSGVTWTGLTTAYCGLPTLTGSAYWSNGSISASGQQIVLSVYGGSLWMSNDYGRTFALTKQVTPNIWLQFNGNLNDTMGGPAGTAPGTVPGYVTVQQPGYSGQAVNLANTAGGTATRYVRGTWAGADQFTVSFWFNLQSYSGGGQQFIFTSGANNSPNSVILYIQTGTNYIVLEVPGVLNISSSFAISLNTWYYVSCIIQSNGLCSLYVNNILINTITSTRTLISGGYFGVGTYEAGSIINAFNGYIADLRIYNSAIAYVPIPLLAPNVWLPFENNTLEQGSLSANQTSSTIYLPFEGSVADTMNFTTVTPYGSPGYVLANRAGYTGQAINLVNTAGGQATQYLDCSWSGSSSFSVSFWYNMQTYNTGQTALFCAYQGTLIIMVYDNSISIYNSANGGIVISSGSRPANNTWHYVTYIHQNSGTCSLYLNNSLVGTYTNSNSLGTTTKFSLGTYDVPVNHSALNGYIDDFRLYNYAITYNPVSIMTVTGSLSYVPGVVGLNAVNLVNTAGGTNSNNILTSCSLGSNFTVSFWFNAQSLPPSGQQTGIFHVGTLSGYGLHVTIQTTGVAQLEFRKTNGTWSYAIPPYAISTNTWYHTYIIYQESGTCSFYLNGSLAATVAGAALSVTPNILRLSGFTYTADQNNAFNGYIDDFRIYNAAIPYHALIPQNYRSVALSGSGQYALASSAGSGWVVGSTDSSATWTKQPIVISQTNDFIQPNQPNLGASTWLKNGITWTASVSSVLSSTTYASYYVFNNTETDNNNSWTSAGTYSNGVYGGSVSTTILGGIGAVTGEWIQIQTSTPLVLHSYRYSCAVTGHIMKDYYIVGSTDGTNWYPVQYVVGGSTPFTAWAQPIINFITVNFTGTQTVIAGNTVTITTTSYATSTTPYNYFRVIANSLHTGGTYAELCELYMNFTNPVLGAPPNALTLSHTGQYQMVATGPAAGSIMPNQSGLADPKWSYSGVQWEVNASSFLGSWSPYKAFNNLTGDGWLSDTVVPRYTSGGAVIAGTTATTTVQGGIGTVTGEWIQLKSSIPLVLSSFGLGIGPNAWSPTNTPKTYYVVGSIDGVTWYPLQNGNFTISNFVGSTSQIQMNTTGTQTFTAGMTGSVATTSYSYSTTAYTYFRLIGTSIMTYGSQDSNYMEIGEWYPVFSNSLIYSMDYGTSWSNTSGTVSNEIVSLSPSGQFSLSTNSVAPFARLTMDNTAADLQGSLTPATGAGTVTYSSSVVKVGSHSAFFNNTAGGGAGNYLSYTVPSIFSEPIAMTQAYWIYRTQSGSSMPVMLANSTYNGASMYFDEGLVLYINFTTEFSNPSGTYISTGVSIPLNTWTHIAFTYRSGELIVYVNGASIYSSSAFTGRVRLVSYNTIDTLIIGGNYGANYAYAGYIDDVRLYTSALSATAIASLYANPSLTQTFSLSSRYLPIRSYTTPVLPSINATIVDAKVSQTGQYMVVVTAGTTNNVYYSTDYGATFTNLTIGSSPMVSCAISHDGSYLIVTNATTTYTLNRNSKGFTLAVGSQAGSINQALNSIAIGNKAGQINQSASSIILNGSGNTLGTVGAGFYVAPVFSAINSAATSSFPLLGYGTDSQIVSLGASVNQTGSLSAVNLSHHQWNNMRISEIRESNIGTQPRYWKIASLGNPGGYGNWGQVTIKGYLGGFYTSESMTVDVTIGSRVGLAINGIVRGTNIANAQNFMDLLYSSNSSGGYDIWLHIKSGIMYIAFDLDVGGDQTYPSTAYLYDPSNSNSVNSVPGPTTSITSACQMGIHGGGGSERTGIIASFLSQGMGAGTSNAIVVGKGFANNNCVTILHNHVADGSANNYLGLGYFGSDNLLTLKANGNIGIGTTNPAYTLDVSGTIRATGNIIANGTALPITNGSVWAQNGTIISYSAGYVGIGTANPSYLLHGYGNSNGGVEMYWQNANADSSAYCLIGVRNNIPSQMVMFLNSNTRTIDGGANVGTLRNDQGDLRLQGGFVANDATGIWIKATTQFVGIGTDSPVCPFQIYNNSTNEHVAHFTNPTTYSRIVINGAAGTGGDIIFRDGGTSRYGIACIASKLQFLLNDSTSTIPVTLDTNGFMGIGTTTPTDGPLCVYNNSGTYVTQKITHAAASNWCLWMLHGITAGAAANFITFNGSDGNLRGSITSSGNNTISYNTGSDLRFKENIEDVVNARQLMDLLRPRQFQMKGHAQTMYGFIAQEVQDSFPELVVTGNTEEKYLYLDYSKFGPIAIAGVKQLYQENDALKARVAELEQTLSAVVSWAKTQGLSI